MTDASSLEERIRRSDPEALESVIRSCLPGLRRTARAAGLPHDRADDAVQAALVTFVEKASEYDGRARATTWIHGILFRKIREQRRGVVRDDADDIDQVVESRFDQNGRWARPPSCPLVDLARGQFREHLRGCLESVPDQQRLAFNLKEVEGFTTAEVCKILEVSANNLGVILYRARNRLRECLEARGFEGSDDASL